VKPEEIDSDTYYTKECFWGSFSRSIILPTAVDTTDIQASFKDGILKITIPKNAALARKTIQITLE